MSSTYKIVGVMTASAVIGCIALLAVLHFLRVTPLANDLIGFGAFAFAGSIFGLMGGTIYRQRYSTPKRD